MFFIVAHNYVVNSGLTADNGPIASNLLSINSIFLLLFGAWGKIGINCFVMITGYFMCKSNITLKKIYKTIRRNNVLQSDHWTYLLAYEI